MAKRTFWLVTGVAIGTGSTLWAERKVRRTVQQAAARLQPDALVVEVGRSARQVAESAGDRVREAVSSGRDEMERHEEELWAELASRGAESAHIPSSEHRERGGRRRGNGAAQRLLARAGTRPAGGSPR
jgi:hypothetical protein